MAVAEKLGKLEELTGGQSIMDKVKTGFENSGVQYFMDYDEFMEKKCYIVPAAEDWEDDMAGFYGFYSDPENYPLTTPLRETGILLRTARREIPGRPGTRALPEMD